MRRGDAEARDLDRLLEGQRARTAQGHPRFGPAQDPLHKRPSVGKGRAFLVLRAEQLAYRGIICPGLQLGCSILGSDGVFGLVATNTIGQGDTRDGGLGFILSGRRLYIARSSTDSLAW
jgi:hypothetical protein